MRRIDSNPQIIISNSDIIKIIAVDNNAVTQKLKMKNNFISEESVFLISELCAKKYCDDSFKPKSVIALIIEAIAHQKLRMPKTSDPIYEARKVTTAKFNMSLNERSNRGNIKLLFIAIINKS